MSDTFRVDYANYPDGTDESLGPCGPFPSDCRAPDAGKKNVSPPRCLIQVDNRSLAAGSKETK